MRYINKGNNIYITLDTLDAHSIRARTNVTHGGEGMRENEIEGYLKARAAVAGGVALKFVSPGCTGVPDRIVILPGGKIGFLELKAPGERPRKDQAYRIRQLQKLGCMAGCADTKEAVDQFIALLGFSSGM